MRTMSGAIALTQVTAFFILLLLSDFSDAALLPNVSRQTSITIVLSRDDRPYKESVSALRKAVAQAGLGAPPVIRTFSISDENEDLETDIRRTKPDLIVTVGTTAAARIESWKIPAPTLCVLLPRQAFDTIWTRTGSDSRRTTPVGAIVLDQPASRQLHLVRMLKLKRPRVALLVGRLTRSAVVPFRTEANKLGIELHAIDLDDHDTPIAGLKKAIVENDVILALPDASTITPQHAKWLLYMAYQRSRPVLAYSQAFVDAGAIAAVYSTPSQIGSEAGEIIARALSTPGTGEDDFSGVRYPKYFTVGTNHSVARSLGIQLPDGTTLATELLRLESGEK